MKTVRERDYDINRGRPEPCEVWIFLRFDSGRGPDEMDRGLPQALECRARFTEGPGDGYDFIDELLLLYFIDRSQYGVLEKEIGMGTD